MNNVFLTGYPAVGKTAIIKRIIKELELPIGGIITGIQENPGGEQCCYLWEANKYFSSRKHSNNYLPVEGFEPIVLGRRKNARSVWQINRQGFNVEAVRILERDVCNYPLLVIDELGRFELQAEQFQQMIERVLLSPVFVLGVLKYERNVFLRKVWDHPQTEVVWVDRSNWQWVYHLIQQFAGPLLAGDRVSNLKIL